METYISGNKILNKYCTVCGVLFYKKVNVSKKKWRITKCCSKECGDKSRIGLPIWNKGLTKETDNRVGQYWLGKKHSPETLKKITKANRINAKKKPKSFFQEMQKKAIEAGKRNHSYKGRLGQIKELNYAWKANAASYTSKHKWILKHWNKTGICQKCGSIPIPKGRLKHATQWHNIDKQYDREDKSKWIELCSKCHHKADGYKTL